MTAPNDRAGRTLPGEPARCDRCVAFNYIGSDFSKPEGRRLMGWCRVHLSNVAGHHTCEHFYSQALQTQQYLERIKK